MASFNPQQNPTDTPNFTGMSEGIKSSPNTGIGDLFAGLADTLNTGTKLADDAEQKKITDDIQDQSEAIQNAAGLGLPNAESLLSGQPQPAQSGTATDPDATPLGLDRGQAQMAKLQNANDLGKIPDVYYWTRMNLLSKQLRVKYPGYSDKIDDMISNVVGSKPANALREELSQVWQSAATQSTQATPLSKLQTSMINDGSLAQAAPDYWQRLDKGDPYSYEELAQKASSFNAAKAQKTQMSTDLSLQASQNTLQASDATRQWGAASSASINYLLQQGTSLLGKDYAQGKQLFMKYQEDMKNGTPPSDQEVQGMRALTQQMRQLGQQTLDREYRSQWDSTDPDPKKSFAYWVAPADDKAAREAAMAPIETFAQALDDKDFGLLNYATAQIAAQTNDASRDILKKYNWMADVAAVNKNLGPQLTGIMFSTAAQQGKIADAVTGIMAGKMATGDTSNPPAAVLSDADKLGVGGPVAQNMIQKFQDTVSKINDPTFNPEVVKNSVKWMTSQDPAQLFQQTFTSKSGQTAFQQIASPEVTQNLLQLKKRGDTDDWNNYVNWVRKAFVVNFKSNLDDLGDDNSRIQSTGASWRVKFNPQTLQFETSGVPGDGLSWVDIQDSKNLAQDMNKNLAVIRPILDDAGLDTHKEITALLSQMGYKL